MKTEKELNADILKMITKIEEICPELSKYIDEMNVSTLNSHNTETDLKTLIDYYDSLYALFTSYQKVVLN
ncbi:hypothetical protein N9R81_02200 [Flavobacteriales bacterium]|nr:hypothetical protein [Flavobacteriales bacterium]